MMVTIRARSAVWFATGATLALVVTLLVFQAWSASAAPGDEDSTYVSITPCRLIDTRPPPDRVGLLTPWSALETKTVQGTGTNGECTIPTDAVGLSLNVTAVGATVETFLTLWPSGALPKASSLNPSPGQPPTPNAVNVTLSSTGSFNLYNNLGTVDVLIDVGGYYTKTSLAEIASRLVALETVQIATSADIAGLAAAQPVAMSDRDNQTSLGVTAGLNGDDPKVIATVTMTPSVAGQITANSVTNVATNDPISGAPSPYVPTTCSITTGTTIDTNYTQVFAPDNETAFEAAGGLLSGTRTIDVAAGVPVSVNLVCQHISGSFTQSILTDSVLTAIYTPAP